MTARRLETSEDDPPSQWESFFATCAKGTELVLKEELRELGLRRVRADRGGVRFEGPLTDAFGACLHSRIAVRVLWPIARFPAPDGDALYEGVRAFAWEHVVTAKHTIAVSATSKQSALGHTQFAAQRTKDAIVDRLRRLTSERPSVDKHDPDLAVFVHLAKDEAGVHLDLSGQSLHRRGWRTAIGEAPLKETLAAAILRMGGWDRERPLLDPMCGSGTIAIEADLWARRVAPNIARERFGFERWASHDESQRRAMRLLRERARDEELPDGPPIFGSDRDPRAITTAEGNARRAGSRVRWTRATLRDRAGTSPAGHVVSNPPYGIRLTDADAMWRELDEALPRFEGHRLSLLLQAPPPPGMLPPAGTMHAVWNGAIECRLVDWDL